MAQKKKKKERTRQQKCTFGFLFPHAMCFSLNYLFCTFPKSEKFSGGISWVFLNMVFSQKARKENKNANYDYEDQVKQGPFLVNIINSEYDLITQTSVCSYKVCVLTSVLLRIFCIPPVKGKYGQLPPTIVAGKVLYQQTQILYFSWPCELTHTMMAITARCDGSYLRIQGD